MPTAREYDINLATLPTATPSTLSFNVGMELFADMVNPDVLGADVRADVTLTPRHGALDMVLYAIGTLSVPCDRCLEPMPLPVDTDYTLTIHMGQEYDDETPGRLTLDDRDPVLHMGPIIHDTLLLAIPMRHVHDRGQCDAAMSALLDSHETEIDEDQETTAHPEP